jgi:hypothetical protein
MFQKLMFDVSKKLLGPSNAWGKAKHAVSLCINGCCKFLQCLSNVLFTTSWKYFHYSRNGKFFLHRECPSVTARQNTRSGSKCLARFQQINQLLLWVKKNWIGTWAHSEPQWKEKKKTKTHLNFLAFLSLNKSFWKCASIKIIFPST